MNPSGHEVITKDLMHLGKCDGTAMTTMSGTTSKGSTHRGIPPLLALPMLPLVATGKVAAVGWVTVTAGYSVKKRLERIGSARQTRSSLMSINVALSRKAPHRHHVVA